MPSGKMAIRLLIGFRIIYHNPKRTVVKTLINEKVLQKNVDKGLSSALFI